MSFWTNRSGNDDQLDGMTCVPMRCRRRRQRWEGIINLFFVFFRWSKWDEEGARDWEVQKPSIMEFSFKENELSTDFEKFESFVTCCGVEIFFHLSLSSSLFPEVWILTQRDNWVFQDRSILWVRISKFRKQRTQRWYRWRTFKLFKISSMVHFPQNRDPFFLDSKAIKPRHQFALHRLQLPWNVLFQKTF